MQSEYPAIAARIGSEYRKLMIGLFSKSRPAFTICIAIAVIMAGCRSRTALSSQEAEGKHLYDVRCAHCHEENDLGLKKVPPDLHNIFDHARLPSGVQTSDVEVQKVVVEGKGIMPAFAGRFTNEQMSDLLSYLHTGIR